MTLASGAGSLKTGKVNALAAASAKRIGALKDTPTFAEGAIQDFVIEQWWGIVVPKGTPAAVIERIQKEVYAAINHASVQERMRELAIEARPLGPEAFATFIDSEIKRWSSVVKAAGIKPE